MPTQSFDKKYEILMHAIYKEFPKFKVKKKSDSKVFWKILQFLLMIVSFGKQKDLMEGYATTLGTTVWVFDRWDEYDSYQKYSMLRHELDHIQTNYDDGYFKYIFGYLFSKSYRAYVEKRGYLHNMHAQYEKYGRVKDKLKKRVVEQLSGPGYLYMMPEDNATQWVEAKANAIMFDEPFTKILNDVKRIKLQKS